MVIFHTPHSPPFIPQMMMIEVITNNLSSYHDSFYHLWLQRDAMNMTGRLLSSSFKRWAGGIPSSSCSGDAPNRLLLARALATSTLPPRPPLPPFNEDTARTKVGGSIIARGRKWLSYACILMILMSEEEYHEWHILVGEDGWEVYD